MLYLFELAMPEAHIPSFEPPKVRNQRDGAILSSLPACHLFGWVDARGSHLSPAQLPFQREREHLSPSQLPTAVPRAGSACQVPKHHRWRFPDQPLKQYTFDSKEMMQPCPNPPACHLFGCAAVEAVHLRLRGPDGCVPRQGESWRTAAIPLIIHTAAVS